MHSQPQNNYLRGVSMILMSAFCFACMNICIRLSGNLPSIQKSFFRNLVAALFAGIIILKNYGRPRPGFTINRQPQKAEKMQAA